MSMAKKVYLIATYYSTPVYKQGTSVKGYMSVDGNISTNEEITITRGIKNSDMSKARIILNITDQKVVKNTLAADKGFMELFSYFYANSSDKIGNALREVGIEFAPESDEVVDAEATVVTTVEPEPVPV